MGSRGSVVPLFLQNRDQHSLPITDKRMTRFWITLRDAVDFTIDCLGRMRGGEIFVPKIPSMRITDLARVIAPQADHQIIGLRPGEKLHEVMVTEDDARNAVEYPDRFVCLPSFPVHARGQDLEAWRKDGKPCPDGFHYGSDNNGEWLSPGQLFDMVAGLDLQEARSWTAERERSVSDIVRGQRAS